MNAQLPVWIFWWGFVLPPSLYTSRACIPLMAQSVRLLMVMVPLGYNGLRYRNKAVGSYTYRGPRIKFTLVGIGLAAY